MLSASRSRYTLSAAIAAAAVRSIPGESSTHSQSGLGTGAGLFMRGWVRYKRGVGGYFEALTPRNTTIFPLSIPLRMERGSGGEVGAWMKRSLTGIKPTGDPHLGNWLGAIRPALELARDHEAFYFIADYHGLTTVHAAGDMRAHTRSIAAAYLAFGLDPDKCFFYRQSDVPGIFELAWTLSCFTPKGFMNRAHAYKDLVAGNLAGKKDPDDGVSMGLFGYPVLMAADILLFNADVLPVGADQKQ